MSLMMNFFDQFLNRIEKEYYGKVIEDIIQSEQFLLLIAILNSDKNLNLEKIPEIYSMENDEIYKTILKIIVNPYYKGPILLKILKNYSSRLNKMGKNPDFEEVNLSLVLTVLGIAFLHLYPVIAIKEDISKILWKDTCQKSLKRIKGLLSTADLLSSKTDNTKAGTIKKILSKFVEKLISIYFFASLLTIHTLKTKEFKLDETKCIRYWASFHSNLIGELWTIQKEFTPSNNLGENTDLVSISLYQLATKVWPIYTKPYHNLASIYSCYTNSIASTYYFCRLFLSLTNSDRFNLAIQEIGTLYGFVQEEFSKYSKEFKGSKLLKIVKVFEEKKDPYLFLLKIDEKYRLISYINPREIFLIRNLEHFIITIAQPSDASLCLTLLVRFLFSSFCYFNLKILMKYDLDNFDSSIQLLSAVLRTIEKFQPKYLQPVFEKLLFFPVISFFVIDASINSQEKSESTVNGQLSHSISLKRSLQILLLFTDFVVNILVKDSLQTTNSEKTIKVALQYLIVVLKWFEISSQNIPDFNSILALLFPVGGQFFIVNLYSWLISQSQLYKDEIASTDDKNDYIPEYVLIGSSIFKDELSKKFCENLSLGTDGEFNSIHYIENLKTLIQNLIKKRTFMFCFSEKEALVFDEKSFIEFQKAESSIINSVPTLTFKDFSSLFGDMNDYQMLMYLYNYTLFISKKQDVNIYYLRSFCPDTNCFLDEFSIMFYPLYDKIEPIISILVLRELVGLNKGKKEKDKQEKSIITSQRAKAAYIALKQNIDSGSKTKILTTNGEILTSLSGNLVEYHDAFQRYDDIILSSFKKYYNLNSRSVSFATKKLFVRPTIFITDDIVLQTKALNDDVICISLKAFAQISKMVL